MAGFLDYLRMAMGWWSLPAVPAPTREGLEYTLPDNLADYTIPESDFGYAMPDGLLHYTIAEEV